MFTQENTQGYNQDQLDSLNRQWLEIRWDERLEPDTDEYYAREKAFSDEVAGRAPHVDGCSCGSPECPQWVADQTIA